MVYKIGKQNPKHKKKHIQRKNSSSSPENIKQSSFSELKPSFNEEFPRFDEILKDFRDAFRSPTFPRENYNSNSLPNFDSNTAKKIFQLKISIKYIRPPIWRRILIEDTATFSDLHDIIQNFFDWDNYHLHEFESRLKDPIETVIRIGCDDDGAYDILNEENVELRQILSMENKRVHYLYDFGDSWEHLIVLEKIYADSDFFDNDFPICIKGKRAAPPEDCGGVYGYGVCKKTLRRWEKRNLITPKRTPGGHRRYSMDDLIHLFFSAFTLFKISNSNLRCNLFFVLYIIKKHSNKNQYRPCYR